MDSVNTNSVLVSIPTAGRFLWGLLCAVLWSLSLPSLGASDGLPNVVFIISDDQAWSDYSFLGHPHIRTPNLDRLARESLTFTRGYVPASLCRPSLATIISGLYPHQHGIVGNDPPRPAATLGTVGGGATDPAYLPIRAAYVDKIDPVMTLPERLQKLGYRSLQTGKWWEGHFSRGGFTEGMTHGDFLRGGRHGDEGLRIGREGFEVIEQFIDESIRQKHPFFLWYAPFLPHTPHNPPAALLDHYRRQTDSLPIAKYWAMCEWFDQTCGDLRELLEQRKLAERTIVVYVTDNGWINDPQESRYAPRSKRSPHEGGVRTPIMIHWPGQIEPQMDTKNLASSIDLVPTILALLGETADPILPGIDLTDRSVVVNRKRIFGEIFAHDVVSLDDPAASLQYRWVIEGPWKLILPQSKQRAEGEVTQLYDLLDDPREEKNRAAEEPQRVQEFRAALDQWWPLRIDP